MLDLLDDYQLPSWPKTRIDRELWNAVFQDIAARLKARELLEASFELLQEQGIQAALDYIQVSIAPQLSSLQDAIASAQAAIDEILGGNAPNAQRLGGQLPAYYATAQALADGLATKANTQEITALIEQRVAALVDSSPAALDTLKELAAAIGDDPNFAATITTALAGKMSTSRDVTVGNGLSKAGTLNGGNLTLSVNKATSADITAGTANKFPDAPVVKAAIAAAITAATEVVFTSSQQTYANGSLLSLAHGLGQKPLDVTVELVCVSADAGFSAGESLYLAPAATNNGAYNTAVSADGTNVFLKVGNQGIVVIGKSTGNNVVLTATSWRMILRAYKGSS